MSRALVDIPPEEWEAAIKRKPGRPGLEGGSVRLVVKVPAKMDERLREMGRKRAQFVRDAIARALEAADE